MNPRQIHVPSVAFGAVFLVLGLAGVVGRLGDGTDRLWVWPATLVAVGAATLVATLTRRS